jgi:hypothetical protein
MGQHGGRLSHARVEEKTERAATAKREKAPPPKLRENRVRRGSGNITGMYSDVREKYKIDPKELGHGHYGVVRRQVCNKDS